MVLTLATPARAGEQAVTLSYTKPATNPVQDSGGSDAPSLTDRTVTNASALNATGKPAIAGVRRVGETLTAAKGTLADPDGLTKADAGDTGFAYTYQWVRVDGATETDIAGATAETYMLGADDEGKKVRVRVSFTDDADTADARTSDAFPEGADTVLPVAVCEAAPAYTGGAREIFSGTLTMGTDGAGEFGFSNHSTKGYGGLAPGAFPLDSTDYTIERATQQPGTRFTTIDLSLDSALPAAQRPRLVLHDCDTPLILSSASGSNGDRAFTWALASADVADWSTYSTRTLRLSHDAVAPTLESERAGRGGRSRSPSARTWTRVRRRPRKRSPSRSPAPRRRFPAPSRSAAPRSR